MSPNRKPRAELSESSLRNRFARSDRYALAFTQTRDLSHYTRSRLRRVERYLRRSNNPSALICKTSRLKTILFQNKNIRKFYFLYSFYIVYLFLIYFYLYYLIKQALSEREDPKEGVCVFLKERVKKQEKKIYKRKEQRNEKEKH